MNLQIEQLNSTSSVTEFSCGQSSWSVRLGSFLNDEALNQQSLGHSSTHLFFAENDELTGFVSLAAHHITLGPYGINEEIYGRPSVPCLLVGQLAVAESYQRQGIGKVILNWVLATAVELPIGIRFLTIHVDQSNEQARNFYEGFGFEDITSGKSDLRFLFYDIYFD